MSNRTKEINKITTTIISISVKLIVYALIILLLYEAVVKGFAFGHEIFYAEAVDPAPGKDVPVLMEKDESVTKAAEELEKKGLIKSEFAFIFQSEFYDYKTIYPGTYVLNTSMTSKEILQKLNEKPDKGDAAAPASGKAKSAGKAAAPAQESGAAKAGRAADGTQAQEQTSGTQDEKSIEAQDSKANQQTYAGEDQETEGGWIEDATED